MKWVLVILIFSNQIFSQGLSIGEWQSHLPHQIGRIVTQTPTKIIYASQWDIMIIEKEDLSASFLSKANGLSDIGIDQIWYDNEEEVLVVAYSNSNIDIVYKDGRIVNLPNIKENNNINGDKRIQDIFSNGRDIFFSTGFGVVRLDLQSLIFRSTTITDVSVSSVIEYDGYIYAGTEDGLYKIVYSDDINMSDFSLWELLEGENGIPIGSSITGLAIYDLELVISTPNTVYSFHENTGADTIYQSDLDDDFEIVFIGSFGEFLLIGLIDQAFSSHLIVRSRGETISTIGAECVSRINNTIIDEQGRIWFGEDFSQIRYAPSINSICDKLTFDSPYHHTTSDIDIKEGSVYACEGGVTDNFQYLFGRQGYYINQGGLWSNYNEVNTNYLQGKELLSMFRVEPHPTENIVYVASFWGGLLEHNLDENSFQVFDQNNSSIQGAVGDEARERISGISFDESENIWVTAHGAASPLNVYTTDGQWYNFEIAGPNEVSDLIIDELGNLWMPIAGVNGGISIYHPGDNVQSGNDDRRIFLNANNSELPVNRVNTAHVDRDGVVWVGTTAGPVIFDCGDEIYNGDCPGVRRKVLQDSIGAFLLADQDIRCIESDGANRKWFGTRNGVFVQSPDGETQIAHYTSQNSPLFDNLINAMAYDGTSGQMYIGTDKGMLSIKTEAIQGNNRFVESQIYAYPNPVEPGYIGPIAIKGLTEDAEVKITDINGQLVYQSTALGGQAIWDGTLKNGERASSGVYLVFSSESSSFKRADAIVTKILLLR